MDTPELIAEAVVPGKAVLFVGLHFGSVELAVVFLAFQVGETVTPMETVDDPGLQAYFERTRGRQRHPAGRAPEARRTLTEALRNGIPVGLVGDRDLTGGGIPIPLFGAPAIAADGSGHARGRERRPGLRDDRAARRRRPLPRQAHPDRRARSTARAASA